MARHRWSVAPLLGGLLLSTKSFSTVSAKERMTVWQGGVKFIVLLLDDGRKNPYMLRFKDNGDSSVYVFAADGTVTSVTAGGTKYKVRNSAVSTRKLNAATSKQLPLGSTELSAERPPLGSTVRLIAEDSDKLQDVLKLSTEKSFGSRVTVIAEDSNELEDAFDEEDVTPGHRRLYACSECEETWDIFCGQGLDTVCDLVGYGDPFGDLAEASVSTMCEHFGSACSGLSALEACQDQCEDEGACDPNPCNGGTCTVDEGGGYICSSCPNDFGGMHCQIDTSDLDPFYIELDYIGVWTTAEKNLVRAQADRWEEVITHVPCGGTRNDPAGRVLISATQKAIDGVGNTLGSAGPLYVWSDCPGVSIEGEMEFDTADLALMSEVELEFLYLHEMGHVIGIGTNWEECNSCYDDRDSEWRCTAAQKVYSDMLGISPPSTADIVELRGGAGTRCGHWSETTFVDEVMTGYSEEGADEPLSKLTVASLEDIGYIIDPGTADPYTLPSLRDSSILFDEAVYTERPDLDYTRTKYYVDSDGEVVQEKTVQASIRY